MNLKAVICCKVKIYHIFYISHLEFLSNVRLWYSLYIKQGNRFIFLFFFYTKREAEKLRKEREAGKQEENSVVSLAERELEQVIRGGSNEVGGGRS